MNRTGEKIFVIRLRATDSAAAIRGLRWVLKTAWRHYGLKVVSVREEEFAPEVMPS